MDSEKVTVKRTVFSEKDIFIYKIHSMYLLSVTSNILIIPALLNSKSNYEGRINWSQFSSYSHFILPLKRNKGGGQEILFTAFYQSIADYLLLFPLI